jgi:hypothetical protein
VVICHLCGGSAGIWPFNTFVGTNIQAPDQHVKEVAIIGMWNSQLACSIYLIRFLDLSCEGILIIYA